MSKTRREKWRFLRLPKIYFSKFILWIFSWKVSYMPTEKALTAVMIVAPHTSNWDFIIGKLAFWALDMKVKVMIKKEWFVFPFGFLLRMFGAFPVDRRNPKNICEKCSAEFAKYGELMICITPEGTRKANPNWKKGFYKISQEAKVPLALTFLDYKTKCGGVAEIFYPSNDYFSDLEYISKFYSNYTAKFPEQFALPKISKK